MNIVAICHSCRKRHTYQSPGDSLYERLGEWRSKHPPGRCSVEYIPDPGGHEIINKVHHEYAHNADLKLAYAGASVDYTITLASLASSPTYVAGRESTAVSNTTNLYLDYLVGGVISTGTSPTADTSIRIYLYGQVDDTPTYPDVLDGTDSAATIGGVELLGVAIALFGETAVDGSSDQAYWFRPTGIAQFFGGSIPENHGLFVSHNTGVNLRSTVNTLTYQGIFMTSA